MLGELHAQELQKFPTAENSMARIISDISEEDISYLRMINLKPDVCVESR
jgi:hypothetical protein